MRFRNMMAMGLRAAAHRTLGRRCPINVMLAVTNRCNSHCHYCDIPVRSQDNLSTGQILKLIDEMCEAGAVRLGLWGGEPLMRPDIGEIVSHAGGKGLYVTMDTNGLLLSKRLGELKDLDHLMVSLDGDRAGHEANRGEGTFGRTMEGLEAAVAQPGMKVWTLTVLTRHNIGDIDFVVATARRLGIHCAFQVLHHNDELGRNHDRLTATDDEYRAAIRRLLALKAEGAPISSSARYLNYLLRWEDFGRHTGADPHLGLTCKAGGLYGNVDADGRVYACSLLVGKVPAANAVDVGFQKAFDAIPPLPCQSCMAACFTEYNYIYGLDAKCIAEWIKTTGA